MFILPIFGTFSQWHSVAECLRRNLGQGSTHKLKTAKRHTQPQDSQKSGCNRRFTPFPAHWRSPPLLWATVGEGEPLRRQRGRATPSTGGGGRGPTSGSPQQRAARSAGRGLYRTPAAELPTAGRFSARFFYSFFLFFRARTRGMAEKPLSMRVCGAFGARSILTFFRLVLTFFRLA